MSAPEDHPRSRGVYALQCAAYARADGSSPLARGLRPLRRGRRGESGIIPARAGFTRAPGPLGFRSADHPRSRGVYMIRSASDPYHTGSSPLARGLLTLFEAAKMLGGIIPARAGFTRSPTGASCAARDHPRSRGVYASAPAAIFPTCGSSPLARGLLAHPVLQGRSARIIPARAGFTWDPVTPLVPGLDHPRSRGVYTCGSLVSQRTRSLPDPRRLHCRPRARSAGSP